MFRKLNQDNKGFTIIEVLIVLAIAGLIMLVVFLAVPSLQRNQRNSGRDADGSRIAAAVNSFISDANGAVPNNTNLPRIVADAGTMSNLGTFTVNTAATAACNAAGQAAMVGGTPATANIRICTGATAAATPFTATADAVVIATGAQCSGADQAVAGSARQAAIFYTKEAGTGFSVACKNI
jgi:prepilin-type N-terminal cleavage/methylation domain-containing protein